MPLGTEAGLGLLDIVLDGHSAPPPLKGHSPPFSANVRSGETAGWTKIALDMEVGLGPGDFVFDGDPAIPRKKGYTYPTQFLAHVLWPNGWMDQYAIWYGGKPLPRRRCVRWGRSSPLKGAQPLPSSFRFMSIVAKTAGWMKTPLCTEVDLGPGHIVLDGVPAFRERGTTALSPLFGPCLLWPRSPISATAELLSNDVI